MKRNVFSLSFLLVATFSCFSQVADSLYLHKGNIIPVTITKVEQFTIAYKYFNEDAEQLISKHAVEKVKYGKSRRVEEMTKKVNLATEDEWEKVQIFYDKAQTTGLTEAIEVKGKTAFVNYNTGAGADRKAEERIKKAAAALGCPFVLIISDKESNYAGSYGSAGLGSKQSVKKGIGFKY
jgi:sRNA-binding regulator protein Hfq